MFPVWYIYAVSHLSSRWRLSSSPVYIATIYHWTDQFAVAFRPAYIHTNRTDWLVQIFDTHQSYLFSHSLIAVVRTNAPYVWRWEVYYINIWHETKVNSYVIFTVLLTYFWSCRYKLQGRSQLTTKYFRQPSQSLSACLCILLRSLHEHIAWFTLHVSRPHSDD